MKEQFGVEEAPTHGNGVIVVDILSQVYPQIESLNKKFAENKLGLNKKTEQTQDKSFFMTQNQDGSVQLEGKGIQ